MLRKHCCVASVQVSPQPQPEALEEKETSGNLREDGESGQIGPAWGSNQFMTKKRNTNKSKVICYFFEFPFIPKRSIVFKIGSRSPVLWDLSHSTSANVLVPAKKDL